MNPITCMGYSVDLLIGIWVHYNEVLFSIVLHIGRIIGGMDNPRCTVESRVNERNPKPIKIKSLLRCTKGIR